MFPIGWPYGRLATTTPTGNEAPMLGFGRNEKGQACLSGTPLVELLASARAGTPAYVYDLDAIADTAERLVTSMGDPKAADACQGRR